MPLLGPSRSDYLGKLSAEPEEQPEEKTSGFVKLLLAGAVGYGLFRLFTGTDQEELEGY